MVVVRSTTVDDINKAETLSNAITIDAVNETTLVNSILLIRVLVNSHSGATGVILRRVDDQNGVEAWGQLCVKYKNTSGKSALGTPETVLSFNEAAHR